jgi:hypothetical protein|nr:MAG TPA: Protein of unknown function (DUF551) [Caudoviricetes sp.]
MTAPSLAYQDAMNGIAILYDALSNAENELDKLKNAWIKCSERMPELDDDGYSEPVLAINEIGNIQVVSFYSGEGCDSCNEITHWMPLPQPPKE